MAGCGTNFYLIWILIGLGLIGMGGLHHFGLWKNVPTSLKKLFFTILALSVAVVLIIEGFVLTGFFTKEEENLDYIIVLGAQVYQDRPSKVLQYRLDKTIEYMEKNPNTICIVTGGKGTNEPFAEAYGMSKYLIEHGIDEQKIILEDQANNTIQNIQFSMKLMDYEHAKVGILTNQFHLYRGMQLAKKQGIKNVYGIPADSMLGYLPNNMFREFFGVTKDVLKGNMSLF